ncbi:KH domain-containing protein C56G2.1, putative [Caerostris darwini]|uniref:KH domain-containing protein C56G2.1, putative n=1 Tax=Caerostris darwini TaxID=1538125 RepID=A0AAV4VAX8_9ARAC|nr:KH domain-containing protein C56G2.1, putative [Caerostris darwini]
MLKNNIQQFIILYKKYYLRTIHPSLTYRLCKGYNANSKTILYLGPSKAISNNFKMPISHFECATNTSENQDNYSEDCNAHGNTSSVVVNGISTDHSRISDVQKVASCENVKRAVIVVSSTNAVGLVENFPATTDNAAAVSVAETLPVSATNGVAEDLPLSATNTAIEELSGLATNAAIEELPGSSIVPVDTVIEKPREGLVATNGATLNPGTLNGASEPFIPREFVNILATNAAIEKPREGFAATNGATLNPGTLNGASEPFIPREFGNIDAQVSNAAFVDIAEGATAAPDAAFAIPGCSTFVPNELSATFASSVPGENGECATQDTLSISNNLKMPISLDECATNASPVNENWKENIATTDAHASNVNGTQDTLAMWKHFKMPITHVEYATMPVSSTAAVVPVENLPVISTSVIVDASTIVPEDTLLEYVFKFPTKYAGSLIGKKGSYKKTIKESTGANLIIFNHLSTSGCGISGSASQIEAALKLIEARFPAEKFPDFSTRDEFFEPEPPLQPPNLDSLKKTLPQNCFAYVRPSAIVSPGHIFVQLLSDDFMTLEDFTESLTSMYDNFPPPDVENVKEGDVCVYRKEEFNIWCRVNVVNVLENGVATIKFLDYGGYLIVPVQTLKQIHSDYLHLPFQAVECHIYDIMPSDGCQWSQQCEQEVHRLVFESNVLQVYLLGYNGDVPIVQVLYAPYAPHNDLSRHLISVGLASSMTACAALGALQFHHA